MMLAIFIQEEALLDDLGVLSGAITHSIELPFTTLSF
jgi:hypothetical protein